MNPMYPEAATKKVTTCAFCGRLLGREYFFTCHVCGATYCYIHLSRHNRAHKPLNPLVEK
jgi:hypothetical protein